MKCSKCGSPWVTMLAPGQPWCNGWCGGATTLEPDEVLKEFPSKSRPGVVYAVTRDSRGLRCNCPAMGDCWHLKEVEAA